MAKGILFNILARFLFIISGYIIHIGLGRYFGPSLYGKTGVILSLITVSNFLSINGMRQAISKYTSEDSSYAGIILKNGVRLQLIFAIFIACSYFMLAGPISSSLKDPGLTNIIRLSALIIPFTALYFSYVGSLNGLRLFAKQAILMSLYSTARLLFVFLLVLIGLKIYGVVLGLCLASILASILGRHLSRHETNKYEFESKKLIKFAFPIGVFFVCVAILMNIDLLMVKSLTTNSSNTGYYTVALTFARTPYFILFAFASVLFPSISKAYAEKNMHLIRKYISETLRYLILLLLPFLAIICVTAEHLIRLFYGNAYAIAAGPLSIIVFGMGFLTIMVVLTSIISAAGKPYKTMSIILAVVPLDILLNYILIKKYAIVGAATATTIAAAAGALISAFFVLRQFHVLMRFTSFIKIVLCSAVVYLLAKYSIGGIYLIPSYIILFAVYFVLLLITKEVARADLEMLKNLFIRRSKNEA